jgi:hypothetical protein
MVTLEGEKIKNLNFDKSFKTEGGGKFSFTIPGNVPLERDSVKFQAKFKGDDEYLKTSKEVTYKLKVSTPPSKIATKLILNEITKVDPGLPIKVEGRLTNESGKGLAHKSITFSTAGTVKLKQDTIPTGTDGTFVVEGEAPPGHDALLEVKALFGDEDPLYQASGSNVVKYPKGSTLTAAMIAAAPPSKIATKLILNEITKVDPGLPIKVEGRLTNGSGEGLAHKSTVKLKQDTIPTGTDGTFVVEGEAPPGHDASLEVKALFGDEDPLYRASGSNVVTYPKGSNYAVLELDPIAGVDPTARIPVKGTLSSSDSHEGLPQKPIRLTVTRTQGTSEKISEPCGIDTPKNRPNVEILSSAISNPTGPSTESESPYTTKTGNDGKFVFDGMEPLCKEGLWEVQAYFDGDSGYGPTRDAESFSTSDDVIVLKAQDIIYEQRADKKEVGIELPIPDPSDLPKGCKLLTNEDHDDKLNEVDIRGTTLNIDFKDKSRSKTIEYSIYYDCTNQPPDITDPDLPVVVDTAGPTVTASPSGGTFGLDQSVTFSSPDADIDKIYYTTDGSEPDNTDAEFTDNIPFSAATGTTTTTTIKFIGYDTHGNAGPVGSETYIIDKLGPTIIANPVGGSYLENISVSLSSNHPDIDTNAIYYTISINPKGDSPSSSSGIPYTGPISITVDDYTKQVKKYLKFIGKDKLGNYGPVGIQIYEMGQVG